MKPRPPFKLHQFLNATNWQNRQYALDQYKQFTLPSCMDCFYWSVEGAITHFYEIREKRGQAYREALEMRLNLYAIEHFGMVWKDFENAKGQSWGVLRPILEELDI